MQTQYQSGSTQSLLGSSAQFPSDESLYLPETSENLPSTPKSTSKVGSLLASLGLTLGGLTMVIGGAFLFAICPPAGCGLMVAGVGLLAISVLAISRATNLRELPKEESPPPSPSPTPVWRPRTPSVSICSEESGDDEEEEVVTEPVIVPRSQEEERRIRIMVNNGLSHEEMVSVLEKAEEVNRQEAIDKHMQEAYKRYKHSEKKDFRDALTLGGYKALDHCPSESISHVFPCEIDRPFSTRQNMKLLFLGKSVPRKSDFTRTENA